MAKGSEQVMQFIPALYVCLSIALIVAIGFAFHYRSLARARAATIGQLDTHFQHAQGVAQNFLNACRLVSIHRNGRMNVFTFMRGDRTFIVETMGLYSDNPDEWRTMAGLTQ